MLPSKFKSPFDYFKEIVYKLYPTVTNLECDNWVDNVEPIKYYDGRIERNEYPPVISWRIGKTRYRYVLAPTLKKVYYDDLVSTLTGTGSRTKVDYHDQERIVLDLIKTSVEGKSVDEMNIGLSQTKRNYESY